MESLTLRLVTGSSMTYRIASFGLFCVMVQFGCKPKEAAPTTQSVPKVTVSQPIVTKLAEYGEYTGYLDARQRVEIRPQIRGRLDKIHFIEGTEITKGTLLYEIDPREYQVARDDAAAALKRAEADLKRTEAELERSTSTLARLTRLGQSGGVSTEEIDQATAAEKTARAAVGQANASISQANSQLDAAELNLSYTKIYAPINGRISRTQVTEGNLVGYGGEPTILTIMVDTDPIYVFFDVPERDAIDYERKAKSLNLPTWSQGEIPVEVGVETEQEYPHRGVINFRDPRFEPGTGTVRLRGILANPSRKLSSGMFARVRFPTEPARDRLLVPAAALLSDQRGRYLLVVNSENVVEYRPIVIGSRHHSFVAVEQGIKADNWIIVSGVQKARPKATVEAQRQPLSLKDFSEEFKLPVSR